MKATQPWSGQGVWRVPLQVAGATHTVNLRPGDVRAILSLMPFQAQATVTTQPGSPAAARLFSAAALQWQLQGQKGGAS